MKTYSAKHAEVERRWFLIDAEGAVLGRLATVVANRLRGKHKPIFTPHVDCGDHIVIVNAEKVQLTGNKRWQKVYHRHTGYPGGIKSVTADDVLDGDHAERVIQKAVERMLPKNKLSRAVIGKLHVYPGSEHPHGAQQPETLDLEPLNAKNVRKG